ncbi:MAG: hypothetical protein IT443_10440 [Phycisphaeraceae bacterium]|nr:hypothetical protein [Phycisphaeraceae bacterium]
MCFSLAMWAYVGGAACPAEASDTTWIGQAGSVGDWFDPVNWSNGVPEAGAQVIVKNNGRAEILSPGALAAWLYLRNPEEGDWSLTLDGGALEVDQYIQIDGSGSLRVVGGLLKTGWLTAGYYPEDHTRIRQDSGSVEVAGLLSLSSHVVPMPMDTIVPAEPKSVYELINGSLTTERSKVGYNGYGVMRQVNGSHAVAKDLTIGGPRDSGISMAEPLPGRPVWGPTVMGPFEIADPLALRAAPQVYIPVPVMSDGRYFLEGGGLTADKVVVENSGSLVQTGGSLTARYLRIDSHGWFKADGGSVSLSAGLDVRGTMTVETPLFLTSPTGLFNFSNGQIDGAQKIFLDLGPQSLLILNSAQAVDGFGDVESEGLIHVKGSDLEIAAGRTVGHAWGQIDDHVRVRGMLRTAPGGAVDLNWGVKVEGGTAELGVGNVRVVNDRSGISEGQLQGQTMTIGGYVPESASEVGSAGMVPMVQKAGNFLQAGGRVDLGGDLALKYGGYQLSDGELHTSITKIYPASGGGKPVFLQTGGKHVTEILDIGATMIVGNVMVLNGISLAMGNQESSSAQYLMLGGEIEAGTIYVGRLNVLWQVVPASTDLLSSATPLDISGYDLPLLGDPYNCTFTIQGGKVRANRINVGLTDLNSSATLAILSAQADIQLAKGITFNESAVFAAVPGSRIVIANGTTELDWTGRPMNVALDIQGQDAAALSGLGNLALVIGNWPDQTLYAYIEAAGADKGAVMAGFVDNFVLGELAVGHPWDMANGGSARVRLMDSFDNQTQAELAEAVYVKHLFVAEGSTLDLNGLNLYYLSADIGVGATIIGGTAIQVPEPGAAGWGLFWAVMTLGRRRKGTGTKS